MNIKNGLIVSFYQLYNIGYANRALNIDTFARENNLDFVNVETECAALKAEGSIVNFPAGFSHSFKMTGKGYVKYRAWVEGAGLTRSKNVALRGKPRET